MLEIFERKLSGRKEATEVCLKMATNFAAVLSVWKLIRKGATG
jgi:hypothetical protein